MNWTRTAITLAVASLTVAAFAQSKPHAMEGKPLPKFSMKDLNGKVVNNETIKGKAVVLDFWATWCGPCIKASPTMNNLHKKYAKSGLVVIGANVQDKAGAAAAYQKKHGYGYKFTTGGEGLLKAFGFQGIPAFVFVDKKGIVKKVQVGFGTQLSAEFDKIAKSLVAG